MVKMDIEEIKEYQLKILKFVKSCCKNLGINYYLCGGTLLGAVRHKGYIPWDDDIDICMERKDYNIFLEFMHSSKNKSKYKSYDLSSDKRCRIPFSKVFDSTTLIIEGNNKKIINLGVNIDLFPIDKMGDNRSKLNKQIKKISSIRQLLILKSVRISNKRNIVKNIIIVLFYIIPITKHKLAQLINKYSQLYVNTETNYKGCLVWGYGEKEIMDKSVFYNNKTMKFEKDIYSIIPKYDEYLTSLYDNYMEFPPIEEQITHHDFIAYKK